jgi:hypothetical protein
MGTAVTAHRAAAGGIFWANVAQTLREASATGSPDRMQPRNLDTIAEFYNHWGEKGRFNTLNPRKSPISTRCLTPKSASGFSSVTHS